jgi:hypothetical protein
VIPDEAVEAATDAMQQFALTEDRDGLQAWDAYARKALEAAAPHMLSHEREQTRLAHLDAMVNRETKRAELAEAWDAGWNSFADFDFRPAGPYPTNPYRSQE